jgi:hypothetical protein
MGAQGTPGQPGQGGDKRGQNQMGDTSQQQHVQQMQ